MVMNINCCIISHTKQINLEQGEIKHTTWFLLLKIWDNHTLTHINGDELSPKKWIKTARDIRTSKINCILRFLFLDLILIHMSFWFFYQNFNWINLSHQVVPIITLSIMILIQSIVINFIIIQCISFHVSPPHQKLIFL